MLNTEEILSRFRNPRKSGRGWIVQCPAHDDRKNSLSLTESNGKLLVKCQAGCPTESVINAVGLEWRDLFTDSGTGKPQDAVTHRYIYTDENGQPLYRVCRTASKNFFQERFEGGIYITGLNGARRVLYNLPEFIKAKTVLVVEGEKDCETLRAQGIVATTNSGGADVWSDTYAESFKGKRVAIIPDNDEPGRRHAWKVARSLLPVAEIVKVVELPDVPEKGDVTDYLVSHTKQDLFALIKAAVPFTVGDAEREQLTEKSNEHKEESVNCYPLTAEDELPVEPQRVAFPEVAWQGVFARWRDIVCPATEAPQEYLWAACLIVIGLVLERHVQIKNPRGRYMQISLPCYWDEPVTTAIARPLISRKKGFTISGSRMQWIFFTVSNPQRRFTIPSKERTGRELSYTAMNLGRFSMSQTVRALEIFYPA